MCIVSNIGDYGRQTIPPLHPWTTPWIEPDIHPGRKVGFPWPPPGPTQEEFDKLKNEMEELKKLLLAGKEYDEATGQADCEIEEKVSILRRLAELVDVDLDDVFGPE